MHDGAWRCERRLEGGARLLTAHLKKRAMRFARARRALRKIIVSTTVSSLFIFAQMPLYDERRSAFKPIGFGV